MDFCKKQNNDFREFKKPSRYIVQLTTYKTRFLVYQRTMLENKFIYLRYIY